MKQRLGVAAALLKDPELLILDEPTNGLDPAGMAEMRDVHPRARPSGGRTVLLSSHLMGEVEQVCDRVGVIRDGRSSPRARSSELRGRAGLRVRAEPLAEAARLVAALLGRRRRSPRVDGVSTSPSTATQARRDQPRAGRGRHRRLRAVAAAAPRSRTSSWSSPDGGAAMTRSIAAELLVLRKRAATWILLGIWTLLGVFFAYVVPYALDPEDAPGGARPSSCPASLAGNADRRLPVLRRRVRADARRVRARQRVRLGHAEDAVHAAARAGCGCSPPSWRRSASRSSRSCSRCSPRARWRATSSRRSRTRRWTGRRRGCSCARWRAGWLILAVWAALGVLLGVLTRGTSLAIGIGILYALVIEGLLSALADSVGVLEPLSERVPARQRLLARDGARRVGRSDRVERARLVRRPVRGRRPGGRGARRVRRRRSPRWPRCCCAAGT